MHVEIVGDEPSHTLPLLLVREQDQLVRGAVRNVIEIRVSPGLRLPVFRDVEIRVPDIIHDDAHFHARHFLQQVLADLAGPFRRESDLLQMSVLRQCR